MQSYTIDNLSINDPTSSAWALVWARLLARDVPSEDVYPSYSLQDEEWTAYLEMTAKEYDGVTYFRPWAAVGMKLSTDSSYMLSVTEDGYSGSFRSPNELLQYLDNVGKNFSALYPEDVQTLNFVMVPRF